jgi:hypothetical protein
MIEMSYGDLSFEMTLLTLALPVFLGSWNFIRAILFGSLGEMLPALVYFLFFEISFPLGPLNRLRFGVWWGPGLGVLVTVTVRRGVSGGDELRSIFYVGASEIKMPEIHSEESIVSRPYRVACSYRLDCLTHKFTTPRGDMFLGASGGPESMCYATVRDLVVEVFESVGEGMVPQWLRVVCDEGFHLVLVVFSCLWGMV